MSKTTPRSNTDRPPNLFPKTSEYFLFLKGAKPVAKVVIGVKFVDGEEQIDGIIVRLPMNAILCQTTCEPRAGMRPILVKKGGREWDKVAEFYARWFAKKRAPDYWDAEAASEELANDLLGVHESNKRDFWQSCGVKFLRGTIVNLSSQAHLRGEEQMTLSEIIAFLEAQPKELCPWYRRNQGRAQLVTWPYSRKASPCPWRAKESIGRAYD